MKKELEDKLFEKYPKIFRQRDLPSTETCMCWGITCGDGWYDIIDTLCGAIQTRVDNVNRMIKINRKNSPVYLIPMKPVEDLICEASQVKQKYGGLRFYVDGGDEFTEGLVCMSESMSYKTCEMCGTPGKTEGRWIKTLCVSCRKNQYKK